jgi:hypothetical protein
MVLSRPTWILCRHSRVSIFGDLLAGGKNSYGATLVERHSRFLMLVKVPVE